MTMEATSFHNESLEGLGMHDLENMSTGSSPRQHYPWSTPNIIQDRELLSKFEFTMPNKDFFDNVDDDDVDDDDNDNDEGDYEDLVDYEDDTGSVSLGGRDSLNLSLSSSDEEKCSHEETPEKIKYQEQIDMLRLRKYFDEVTQNVQERRELADRLRDQLFSQKLKLRSLEARRDELFRELTAAAGGTDRSIAARLRRQHEQAVIDIDSGQLAEDELHVQLINAEAALNDAEVELSLHEKEEASLRRKEGALAAQKEEENVLRERKKKQILGKMEKSDKRKKQKQLLQKEELEKQAHRREDDARISRGKHKKFLQETKRRLDKKRSEDEKLQQEWMERRMTNLLQLRRHIEFNREKLEKQRRNRGESQGVKVTAVKDAGDKEELEKIRKAIIEKIKNEELLMKKRKKRQPYLFMTAKSHPENLLSKDVQKDKLINKTLEQYMKEHEPKEHSGDASTERKRDVYSPDSLKEETDSSEGEEFVPSPEFRGEWDRLESANPLNQKVNVKLKERLSLQRELIVKPQLVAGKEFKGAAFASDPAYFEFKDFEVGEVFKKKAKLTNISYSINSVRFLGVSETLQDVVKVSFTPPGRISAGTTCDLVVSFKPLVNKNLEGEVRLLSENGPLNIPVKCKMKQVDVKVEEQLLDFGVLMIGRNLTKSIIITNNGALPTAFEVQRLPQDGDDQKDVKEEENCLKESSSFPEDSALKSPFEMNIPSTRTISAHSSERIDVIWNPGLPGIQNEKLLIKILADEQQNVELSLQGQATDLPVKLENATLDLRICAIDCLYQNSFSVQNSASAALQLRYEVTNPALRAFLEVLPKSAYVQAHSSFSAQVKFLPREEIRQCTNLLWKNKDLNQLEMPVNVFVSGQDKPLIFLVHAVITSTDLAFSPERIDFGPCNLFECVQVHVKLTNQSELTQRFGFVKLPETIHVGPNDGFGTILPLEELEMVVNFQPTRTGHFTSNICCKNEFGRSFKIKTVGIGVISPLTFSTQSLVLPDVELNSEVKGSLTVSNRHLEMSNGYHDAPQIGAEPIAEVGPASFEFAKPLNSSLSIFPSSGVLEPGESCIVEVKLKMPLDAELVRTEADKIEQEMLMEGQQKDGAKGSELHEENSKKLKAQRSNSRRSLAATTPSSSQSSFASTEIRRRAEEAAIVKLSKNCHEKILSEILQCRVAVGDGRLQELEVRYENSLHLLICCSVVPPSFVIESISSIVQFGAVPINQASRKAVKLRNISNRIIKVNLSFLDHEGVFQARNAVRKIKPQSSFTLLLQFLPTAEVEYFELLTITEGTNRQQLKLKGCGLSLSVGVSLKGEALNVGYVMLGEQTEVPFEISNPSDISADYCTRVVCNGKRRAASNQLLDEASSSDFDVTTVFQVFPESGRLLAGQKQKCLLIFSPACEASDISAILSVSLSGRQKTLNFSLHGGCSSSTGYIAGDTQPVPFTNQRAEKDGILIEKQKVILSIASGAASLLVGCCHNPAGLAARKNIEWSIESVCSLNSSGILVDHPKGTVEAGKEKEIKFTFKSQNSRTEKVRTATMLVKGNVVRQLHVYLLP